jgi:hypothetical protein
MRGALERLAGLPRAALADATFTSALLIRLRDEGGAAGHALVRRLAPILSDIPGAPKLDGDPDPAAQRDILLWRIARVRGREAIGWREQAAASPDPLVLRAVLADVARDPARELLPVLARRVALQAEGTLPLDGDPIDQHRLFSTVFDDVRSSPTPLRPLAVKLRDKAAALARGPIDRFIARHGAVRAP